MQSFQQKAPSEKKEVTAVALLGRDYPGTRFEIMVSEGEAVTAGQAVMRERKRPQILFTSPAAGTVKAINRGPKRSLVSLCIQRGNSGHPASFDMPSSLDGQSLRTLLLQSGLWTMLRTRPFGHIPSSGDTPSALFLTAIDTRPLAPDPATVISIYRREFTLAVNAVKHLCDGPIYLCKSVHDDSLLDSEITNTQDIIEAEFSGAHPAGLPSTHIHALHPVSPDGGQVWQMDYQDLISLGHLLDTGTPWYERVISVAGSAINTPRLLTVPLGGATDDILKDALTSTTASVISGSALDGRPVSGSSAFLGQKSLQITATTPGECWMDGDPPQYAPLVPTCDLDQYAPPGILATPFLRALLVGDIDLVRDLGGLELVEEDMAMLSALSSTRADFRPLLREMLDQMYQEYAVNTQAGR